MLVNPASLTVPIKTMQAGESGVINVEIACPQDDCRSLDITLQFDPKVIKVDSVEAGSSLIVPSSTADNWIDNDNGLLRLIADIGEQPVGQAAQSRSLDVHIQALHGGVSPMTVARMYVFDGTGQPISAVSIDGGVLVSGEATPQPEGTCIYEVRAGDTLSSIAVANGVTLDQINAMNNIPNERMINIGQQITIPAKTCYAPPERQTNDNGSSQTFQVYDCRNISGKIFEWYAVRVDYDINGNPLNATRIGGPFQGTWRPGCPAPQGGQDTSSSSGSSSSSGNSHSGGGNNGGGSGNPPTSVPPTGVPPTSAPAPTDVPPAPTDVPPPPPPPPAATDVPPSS